MAFLVELALLVVAVFVQTVVIAPSSIALVSLHWSMFPLRLILHHHHPKIALTLVASFVSCSLPPCHQWPTALLFLLIGTSPKILLLLLVTPKVVHFLCLALVAVFLLVQLA